jgi:sugar lactone lactonase YvrE
MFARSHAIRLASAIRLMAAAVVAASCGEAPPAPGLALETRVAALSGPRGTAGDKIADVEVGRRDFTEITPREVFPDKVSAPGGVVVDTTVSPGRAYVWDSGNNRILGLDLSSCYATSSGTRCTSQLVFGQTSGSDHGACNQDSSAQQYPQRPAASASTLCGMRETAFTVLEDKSFAHMFVDGGGNLWVPDALNNRVLKFNTPFATDTVADGVWGQTSFAGNGCNGATSWLSIPNPTASTLCFWDPNGVGSGSGVRLDAVGNLWVADGGNNRVLRFPKSGNTIATTADIVLGQTSFTARAAGTVIGSFNSPTAVLFDSSGRLYVADGGNHRIVLYTKNASGAYVASATPFLTLPLAADQSGPDDIQLDPDGRGIWITTPPTVASPNPLWVELYDFNGALVSSVPAIQVGNPGGGSIGFDAQKRLLVSAYVYGQDVYRYTKQADGSYLNDKSFFSPPGGYNLTTARRFEAPGWVGVGVADHVSNPPQLVATDSRLMFWNNPTAVTMGQAPTGCVGDCLDLSPGFSELKVDAADRIWVTREHEIDVYQAPLSAASTPIKVLTSVPILGGGTVDLTAFTTFGLVPSPDGQYLWLSQTEASRAVRVRGPLTASPIVDIILGQTTTTGADCNRGVVPEPNTLTNLVADLTMLCMPSALSMDRMGNLYVADDVIEDRGNWRLLMFGASTFPATPSSVLFAPAAAKSFPKDMGTTSFPNRTAVFEPAFDASNRMVVGFNPYTGVRNVQFYNNPTAVNPSNPSDPAFAVPDGQLEDFSNWVIASAFDSANNLWTFDANRGQLRMYKTPFGAPPAVNVHGQYENGDPGAPSDSQIKPNFALVNSGATTVALPSLNIRYYFSSESTNPTNANFFVDYAAIGNSLVHGRFVAASCGTTDAYLEVSFSGGSLAPGASTGEIKTRFSKPDFSAYNENNDYSYRGSQSTYADSTVITVYSNGTRVWGTPPAGCN